MINSDFIKLAEDLAKIKVFTIKYLTQICGDCDFENKKFNEQITNFLAPYSSTQIEVMHEPGEEHLVAPLLINLLNQAPITFAHHFKDEVANLQKLMQSPGNLFTNFPSDQIHLNDFNTTPLLALITKVTILEYLVTHFEAIKATATLNNFTEKWLQEKFESFKAIAQMPHQQVDNFSAPESKEPFPQVFDFSKLVEAAPEAKEDRNKEEAILPPGAELLQENEAQLDADIVTFDDAFQDVEDVLPKQPSPLRFNPYSLPSYDSYNRYSSLNREPAYDRYNREPAYDRYNHEPAYDRYNREPSYNRYNSPPRRKPQSRLGWLMLAAVIGTFYSLWSLTTIGTLGPISTIVFTGAAIALPCFILFMIAKNCFQGLSNRSHSQNHTVLERRPLARVNEHVEQAPIITASFEREPKVGAPTTPYQPTEPDSFRSDRRKRLR